MPSPRSSDSSLYVTTLIVVAMLLGVAGIIHGFVRHQATAGGERGLFMPMEERCKQVERRDDDGRTRYETKCHWRGTFEGVENTIEDVSIENALGSFPRISANVPVDAVRGTDGTVYRAGAWIGSVALGGFMLVTGGTVGVVRSLRKRKKRLRAAGQMYYPMSGAV